MRKLLFLFHYTFFVLLPLNTYCQEIDSTSFELFSRQSFYSFEKEGEFLLHIPNGLTTSSISVSIFTGTDSLTSWNGIPGNKIIKIPFSIKLAPSSYIASVKISVSWRPAIVYHAYCGLDILTYKSNEVKIDRLTGGLIVNRRQFYPFGFYCYSPVESTLLEEEIVKGFNMISPYQKILPESLEDRRAYMDRCAQIGMKVNYNLLSVAGGGGVGSKIEGLDEEEKMDLLINEIITFRDHPALLAWYISDEPNGYKIPPEVLEKLYHIVRENDPWHPVTIVFMAPHRAAQKYINALDIVMADLYPIPDLPASMLGDVAIQLRNEFEGKRPLWMVPQAFGGGELWWREPTLQEVRSMTWQSIINGATGIQYFVRQGLNHFPKSTATWSECGKIAMEVAELTPWLLSDEKPPKVMSYSGNIIVSSRVHNKQVIVMAVNKRNVPSAVSIRIEGVNNKKAVVMFENRSVTLNGGIINDQISPFGSKVYLIETENSRQMVDKNDNNLLRDSGFEDMSSPGIPSACYARPGGDRGATYFLDTREHFEGTHSLRIVTPSNNKSVALRFFPFQVKAGYSYSISIWAKSDPEQRFFMKPEQEDIRLSKKETMPQYTEISLGDFGLARFVPDSEWRKFVTFVTIPEDTTAVFKTNLILKMPGQGVAWFDKIKVFEEK